MIGEVFVLVVLAAFFFGGLGSVVKGLRGIYRGFRVWKSEPVPANEVRIADGLIEVEGKVQTIDGNTFEAKYSGKSVVAHDWEKEVTSKTGPNSPSVETISSGEGGVPFYVFDGEGYVAVDPEGANISLSKTTVSDREEDGNGKELEGRLEEGDEVHVYGQKRNDIEDSDELGGANFYIGDGNAVPEFRITDGSETSAVVRLVGMGVLYVLIGILVAAYPSLLMIEATL